MNWLDMSPSEVKQKVVDLGEPAFRAKQVFAWLHKGATVDQMHNLPQQLRSKLKETPLGGVTILEKRISKIDGTVKYLFLLEDNQIVEGVFMRYNHGNTLCISTQVGCRMGCTFCASTLEGLIRNLSAGEMLGQVLAIEYEQHALGEAVKDQRAITNVVLMGSGEPFDNYEQVIRFLHLINDPEGICFSLRNISISTCGLIPYFEKLAQDAPGVNLCISLHAPTDELRETMMPIAKTYPIEQLMVAVREFVKVTKRRIIIEYALVQDVNDSSECALMLSKLLRNLQCHVNLIPLNEVKERNLASTSLQRAHAFCKELTELGISATVRREMGDDIQGACGQLRRSYYQTKNDV